MTEKQAKALALHQAGKNYRAIGEEIGCSSAGARDLVLRAKRRQEQAIAASAKWTAGLQTRLANLVQAEFSDKEELVAWLTAKRPRDIPMVGPHTVKVLAEWAGVSTTRPTQ